SASPTSGAVDPASEESITVNVDATGLEPGIYTPHLCLETNSSRHELLRIPINIYIACPPEDTSCVPPTVTPEPYPTETPTPQPTPVPGNGLPDASFTPSTQAGPAPLTVEFTNTSSGEIDSYLWEFGNGETSVEENPSVTYTEPGAYPVKLTATNGSGSSSYQLTVTAHEAMVADFSADILVIETLPTTVTFTNLSTGAFDSCTWEIGNEATHSGCETVSHTFEAAGTFDVKLTISGEGGEASATKASYITSSPALPQVDEFFIYMPMMME
ncbi:MAG: PKD domain-containing protein, partial [Chloroflexota bacterium]